MPGFSTECQMGAHPSCAMGQDCRCDCHAWTQALKRKGPAKPDPRGGVRRKLKKNIADTIAGFPQEFTEDAPLEVHNTCPTCGTHARPTDTFCRKDGARLAMGKQCLGCGAAEEPDDVHCWNCGLKAGTKPPEPAAEAPQEDPLTRIRRQAQELGLLKETTVS